MTTYTWPGWKVSRFELRVQPNLRTFIGTYTPTVQVLDFMGERLTGTITLVLTNDPIEGAAREAFFDRLKGQANTIQLYHLKLKAPQGTARDGAAVVLTNTAGAALNLVNTAGSALVLVSGYLAVRYGAMQGDNTVQLSTQPGKTLLAGDPLSINGQWIRVMANATADGGGAIIIEFQPRARAAWAVGLPATWNQPTFNAMLKTTDAPPTAWVPGYTEGISFDFIEQL
jgi:hypothetical protein